MAAVEESNDRLDSKGTDTPKKSEKKANDAKTTTAGQAGPKEGRAIKSSHSLDFILDIPLEVTVELGRTRMLVSELLNLGQGSVLELSKLAGETMEILANQKLIARGEVVVVNDKYGVRLTEVISPSERLEGLR